MWNRLKKFILDQRDLTDVFCLLETDPEIKIKLDKLFTGFSYIYYKGIKTAYLGGVREGRIIYYSAKIKVLQNSSVKLFNTYRRDAGGMITAEMETNGKRFELACIHGKARPGSKNDTPIRLNQSEIIINRFKNTKLPVIIGGDFNLNPDTRSIEMFETAGYRNLIKEFNIKSTRNKYCWDQFPEQVAKFGRQYFADYCFVSKGVTVLGFEVPNAEVSDHEPQILEFEI